jgi:preprotein translocase subunit SecB
MSEQPNGAPGTTPLAIRAQYIKDLSFENPNPIAIFSSDSEAQPSISVGIQAKAQNLGDRNFEVVLDIRIDATRDKDAMFVAELSYAGVVTVDDSVAEDLVNKMVMVEAPRLLFPFARNILADMTRDGGFPPLLLAPVDFEHLYEQQKSQGKAHH